MHWRPWTGAVQGYRLSSDKCAAIGKVLVMDRCGEWRPRLWAGGCHICGMGAATGVGGCSGGKVVGVWVGLRSGGKCSRGFRIIFYCFGRFCSAGANRREVDCSSRDRFAGWL